MNRLQYVKVYFNTFIAESDFRNSIKRMSLDFTEQQLQDGYKYILTLKPPAKTSQMNSLSQRQSAARVATNTIANGIRLNIKSVILNGFAYVEQEGFSWDDMDEEFERFDIYSQQANKMLYPCTTNGNYVKTEQTQTTRHAPILGTKIQQTSV